MDGEVRAVRILGPGEGLQEARPSCFCFPEFCVSSAEFGAELFLSVLSQLPLTAQRQHRSPDARAEAGWLL